MLLSMLWTQHVSACIHPPSRGAFLIPSPDFTRYNVCIYISIECSDSCTVHGYDYHEGVVLSPIEPGLLRGGAPHTNSRPSALRPLLKVSSIVGRKRAKNEDVPDLGGSDFGALDDAAEPGATRAAGVLIEYRCLMNVTTV